MRPSLTTTLSLLTILVLLLTAFDADARRRKRKKKRKAEDLYAEYVWPPPPDQARIRLTDVVKGRADVEATSRFKKFLIGTAPQSPYDRLNKPFAVAFDSEGRILVSEAVRGAVIRFDREGRRMDVFGTRGAIQLQRPLGLEVGPDDTLYVADVGLKKVVAFTPKGKIRAIYGRRGELVNPTDSALTPDGERLLVADSKAHKIFVYNVGDAELLSSFGQPGDGEGEFAFPTSLAFGPQGRLFVVDQANARVQVFNADGEYLAQFGSLGVGFANFVRPKDVAVDEVGFIYVTDNAFNNVQIFNSEFRLLTFVGQGGTTPGRFHGASGVDVRGAEFAVVDQLGRRLQVFRFLVPKTATGE
ncbi:MAG: hypothetical protein GY856_21085 [bacterium]|nr:hypothetical protein [bacterium]